MIHALLLAGTLAPKPDLTPLWKEYEHAYTSRNLDAMMRLFDPDAVVTLRGYGTLSGASSIRSFWKNRFATAMGGSLAVHAQYEAAFGHDVVVSGTITGFRKAPDGARKSFTVHFMDLLDAAGNGRYRIARSLSYEE